MGLEGLSAHVAGTAIDVAAPLTTVVPRGSVVDLRLTAPEEEEPEEEAAAAPPEEASKRDDDEGDPNDEEGIAVAVAHYAKRIEKLEDALVYHWRKKANPAALAELEHKLKKYRKKKHKAKKRLRELRGEDVSAKKTPETYESATAHAPDSVGMATFNDLAAKEKEAKAEANAPTEVRNGVTYRVFEKDPDAPYEDRRRTLTSRCTPKTSDIEREREGLCSFSRAEMSTPVSKDTARTTSI